MVETFTQQMQAQAGSTPESSPVPGMQRNQEGGVIVFGTNFEVGRNYEILSPIGQGAYGVVVAARVKNMSALPRV